MTYSFWIGFLIGASVNALLVILFTALQNRRDAQADEEAIALGFPDAHAAREHAAWLATNGT